MAKERVRHFLYRGKSDQGNERMRALSYLVQWLEAQAARLGTTTAGIIDLLRGGSNFENIEATATPPEEEVPANAELPVVTGTAQVGQLLTVSDGTWTGTPEPTYTYQWKVGGVNIAEATENTYTPAEDDVGEVIICTVTATNTAGEASADTAPTAAVIEAA